MEILTAMRCCFLSCFTRIWSIFVATSFTGWSKSSEYLCTKASGIPQRPCWMFPARHREERRDERNVSIQTNHCRQKEKCRMRARSSFPRDSMITEKQSLKEGLGLRTSSFPKRYHNHYVCNSDFLGSLKSNNDFRFQFYFPTVAEKEVFPCPVPPRY